MKNHLLATLLLIFTSACASVQSVSLTSIPADRKKPVQAQATKTIFLGFNFDNDFVDQLTPNLEKQCPEGKVAGLLTKDESINYFFYFVHSRKVTAKGYCVAEESVVTAGKNSGGPQ